MLVPLAARRTRTCDEAMTKKQMTPYTVNIIQDLKTILEYHQTSGIEFYPVADEIDAVLRIRSGVSAGSRIASPESHREKHAVPTARPIDMQMPKPARAKLPTTTLDDIRTEVAACAGCRLSEKRVVPVAGHGGGKVRLLVVGDWLALEDGQQPPSGCLFGIEQDRMLGKMLDAIKLPRDQVFVANVIKCGIPTSCQPQAEHVHACLSYLHRQIVILQPQVILTMGMIATRTLLNRRESLSRLRGRLHTYLTPEEREIPLIATYHPTFLLQNPEMKRATWFDLQLLAKQLGTGPG